MIDTHTHIYCEEFDSDRAEAIARARSLGVEHYVMPCINRESVARMEELEKRDPSHFHSAIGLHPEEVKDNAESNYREELSWMETKLKSGKWCAIGEIGIDLHWDTTWRKEQIEAFEMQLEWAKRSGLPALVHTRDAWDEVMSCIRNVGLEDGIMHCFGGSVAQAKEVERLGNWKIGIGGIVTFKNSGLGEVLSEIGIGNVVLETDDPWLAPVPYRGKRNEPSYLVLIVNKIAELTRKKREEVVKKTTKNALDVLKTLTLQAIID